MFDDCMVATGLAPHLRKSRDLQLDKMSRVIAKSAGVRWTGSAALDLSYLAAGRFDAYWSEGLKSWDMAAGLVILKEAGGFYSDLAGRELDMAVGAVAAGNQAAHTALLAAIKE
jgi:myo-inositol-1(or 4)-monophosphatase